MTWRIFILLLIFVMPPMANAQEVKVKSQAFDKELKSLLSLKVPVISVRELYQFGENKIVLDARKKEEYDVSHIPGAKHLGYKNLNKAVLKQLHKNDSIVVYCSVGYRSEKIGQMLLDSGFENVYNLYGSIFEWVNCEFPVVDNNNQISYKIHTYNKKWSRWVTNPKITKTW